MSAEQNKALVRGYLEELLNRGDRLAVEKYVGPDGVVFNGKRLSPDQVAQIRTWFLTAFPDFHLTIEDQIAEGDKVVTRVTFRGTHKGEAHGLSATGKRVAYQGIAIDRIVGGKLVEMWHEADTWGMLRQLGAVAKLAE